MRLGRPDFVRLGTGGEGRRTALTSISIAASGSATSMDTEAGWGVEIKVSGGKEGPSTIFERAA